MVSRFFEGKGVNVEASMDALKIVTRVEAGSSPWDVVLLDVNMPGIGGYELLEKFREAGSVSSVIMLSGDNTADTAASCMRTGAFDYLTKPCETARMLEVVMAAARYSQMQRASIASGTNGES